MSNMTPFEIRLELLKMARDMLNDDYYGKREQISNQWSVDCDTAKLKGEDPPKHPGYPPFPSESEVITKAATLCKHSCFWIGILMGDSVFKFSLRKFGIARLIHLSTILTTKRVFIAED